MLSLWKLPGVLALYLLSLHCYGQDISDPSLNRSCPNPAVANLYGNVIPGKMVLGPRLPDRTGLAIPASCNATVDALFRKWQAADLGDYESLANRVCSAYQGWVERVPGTCKAGGPPPICKVDHWYRNPGLSLQRLHEDEERKKGEREREMADQACGCYMQQVESQGTAAAFNKPVWNPYSQTSPQTTSQSTGNDPNELPCTTTCSIEGYKCVNGLCRESTNLQIAEKHAVLKAVEKGDDTAIDLVQDAVKEDFFSLVGKDTALLFESTGMRVASRFLSEIPPPTPIGLWSQSYETSLRQVDSDREALSRSYNGMISWLRGRNPWAPNAGFSAPDWLRLVADLNEIRSQKQHMREHLDAMNTALAGLQTEHELGQKACYNVIGMGNSRLNASVARLLELPDAEPTIAH